MNFPQGAAPEKGRTCQHLRFSKSHLKMVPVYEETVRDLEISFIGLSLSLFFLSYLKCHKCIKMDDTWVKFL